MAENVKGPPAGGPKKRGRPAGSKNGARAAAAAAKADAMVGGKPVLAVAPKGDQAPAGDQGDQTRALGDPPIKPPEAASASGHGHNRLNEGTFLSWVHRIRREAEEVEKAKLALKNAKGKYKDLRSEANGAGMVLGLLDEAIKDLDTERVDLADREETRRLYREWLNLPLGTQTELDLDNRLPSAAKPGARWFNMGNTAGRLGEKRDPPSGIPPENIQDFLKGYDAGQKALMQTSPLTRDGFDEAGELKPQPEGPADGGTPSAPAPSSDYPKSGMAGVKVSDDGLILVLQEAAFRGGTALEHANRLTYTGPGELWENAERIVALYGSKRRILKEPAGDGVEAYEDTGEKDVPVTDEDRTDIEDPLAAAAEAFE